MKAGLFQKIPLERIENQPELPELVSIAIEVIVYILIFGAICYFIHHYYQKRNKAAAKQAKKQNRSSLDNTISKDEARRLLKNGENQYFGLAQGSDSEV